MKVGGVASAGHSWAPQLRSGRRDSFEGDGEGKGQCWWRIVFSVVKVVESREAAIGCHRPRDTRTMKPRSSVVLLGKFY